MLEPCYLQCVRTSPVDLQQSQELRRRLLEVLAEVELRLVPSCPSSLIARCSEDPSRAL